MNKLNSFHQYIVSSLFLKKVSYFSILLCVSIILPAGGCAVAPTHGFLYTNTQFPGEFNPSQEVPSVRSALGCQYSYLGLFSYGSSAAGEIARRHEIRRIATVDHTFTGILFPVYGKLCTTVTGD